MIEKRIHSVGKYKDPEDVSRPYWVKLYWFEGNYKPLEQPISEEGLFNMLNGLFEKQHLTLTVETKLGR